MEKVKIGCSKPLTIDILYWSFILSIAVSSNANVVSKMKSSVAFLVLLSICNIGELHANESTVEDKTIIYKRLIDDIHDYKKYSNEEIYTTIQNGLNEKESENLNNVLNAIAGEALYSVINGEKERDFKEVKEFKKKLISLVKNGIHNFEKEKFKEGVNWWLCLLPLAVTFPGDIEIEEILLEVDRKIPDARGDILNITNIGSFNSNKVDNLRIDSLASGDKKIVKYAALGIKGRLSEKGLEILGRQLKRNDESIVFIIDAIAAYDGPALKKANVLSELIEVDKKINSGELKLDELNNQIAKQKLKDVYAKINESN